MTIDVDSLIERLDAAFVTDPSYLLCAASAAALRAQRDEIERLSDAWTAMNELQAAEWRRAERDAAAENEGNCANALREAIAERDAARAEAAALRRDAERWDVLCTIWCNATIAELTQDEDGRWSIAIVEGVENCGGKWTGDDPDAAIDAAIAQEGK